MRNLLVVTGVALLVVVIYGLSDYGLGRSGGSLPPTTALGERPAGAPPGPPAVPPAGDAAAGPLPGAPKPVLVTTPAGFHGRCQERGEVGVALLKILEITSGQDFRTMDRGFTFEYAKILQAWTRDPARKDADVELLLEAWRVVDDPAVHWALSWLFEKGGDDRFVEPLAQIVKLDPWRATDSLANLGSPLALARLVELVPGIPKPEVRSQARIRIARSGLEEATDYLVRAANDRALTDPERLVAVEALGLVEGDGRAMLQALDIALGPARPVGDLGERNADHPDRDLRSAAVLAIMKRGDQDLTRRLLETADRPDTDPTFTRMVDVHLGGYQGADLSRLIFGRIARRGRVSIGEARYLNNVCTRGDVDRLKGIIGLGDTQQVRDLLNAAALNAATRE